MDPQLTKEGKPYGPARYKEIVTERYLISKNINTSYNDIGKMTPLERQYILELLVDEQRRIKDLEQKRKLENSNK